MQTKKEFVSKKLSTLSNCEAEMCLLGCILNEQGSGEATENIFELVDVSDFCNESSQKIFQAMKKLWENGKTIDFVSVSELLQRQYGNCDIEFLTNCSNMTIGSVLYTNYLKIVKDYSGLRKAENVCFLGKDLVESGKTAETVVSILQEELSKITEGVVVGDCEHVADASENAFQKFQKRANGQVDEFGLETGFNCLDRCLWGLQKSDLIVVAARAGVGKTAFALNIINQAAIENKKTVAFYSLEMPKEQIVERLYSLGTGISNYDLKSGKFNKKFKNLSEFKEKLKNSKLFIDDDSNNTVNSILLKSKRLKRQQGLDLVVVDYLQFIRPQEKTGTRFQDVGEIARGLKKVARILNVPVIALCQLNRQLDKEDREPTLADLRESGEIENNADIVMFLNSKSKKAAEVKDIDLIIGKFRNGALRSIRLTYEGNCFKFTEKDKAQASHEQLELDLEEMTEDDGLPF